VVFLWVRGGVRSGPCCSWFNMSVWTLDPPTFEQRAVSRVRQAGRHSPGHIALLGGLVEVDVDALELQLVVPHVVAWSFCI
jgi:hypothetical protein